MCVIGHLLAIAPVVINCPARPGHNILLHSINIGHLPPAPPLAYTFVLHILQNARYYHLLQNVILCISAISEGIDIGIGQRHRY